MEKNLIDELNTAGEVRIEHVLWLALRKAFGDEAVKRGVIHKGTYMVTAKIGDIRGLLKKIYDIADIQTAYTVMDNLDNGGSEHVIRARCNQNQFTHHCDAVNLLNSIVPMSDVAKEQEEYSAFNADGSLKAPRTTIEIDLDSIDKVKYNASLNKTQFIDVLNYDDNSIVFSIQGKNYAYSLTHKDVLFAVYNPHDPDFGLVKKYDPKTCTIDRKRTNTLDEGSVVQLDLPYLHLIIGAIKLSADQTCDTMTVEEAVEYTASFFKGISVSKIFFGTKDNLVYDITGPDACRHVFMSTLEKIYIATAITARWTNTTRFVCGSDYSALNKDMVYTTISAFVRDNPAYATKENANKQDTEKQVEQTKSTEPNMQEMVAQVLKEGDSVQVSWTLEEVVSYVAKNTNPTLFHKVGVLRDCSYVLDHCSMQLGVLKNLFRKFGVEIEFVTQVPTTRTRTGSESVYRFKTIGFCRWSCPASEVIRLTNEMNELIVKLMSE